MRTSPLTADDAIRAHAVMEGAAAVVCEIRDLLRDVPTPIVPRNYQVGRSRFERLVALTELLDQSVTAARELRGCR